MATTTDNLINDLNALISQGNTLITTLSGTTLDAGTMDSQMSDVLLASQAYNDAVLVVFNNLAGSSLTLSDTLLTQFDTLSSIVITLSSTSVNLTQQITTLAPGTGLTALELSLSAMLSLADDIGTMADRIGEMANRILIMADNIGLMADRILATQQIQNTNIKLTYDFLLESQRNAIILISLFLG